MITRSKYMNEKKVPSQFIDEFIKYLPRELINAYSKCYPMLDNMLHYHINDFFSNVNNIAEEKMRIYQYYYYIKRSYLKDVEKAIEGKPTSKKSILGIIPKKYELTPEKYYQDILQLVNTWSKEATTQAYQFPLFFNLSPTRIEKGFCNDIMFNLIEYIDNYYSGSKEFIFNKSTAYLISSAFFGEGSYYDQNDPSNTSIFENEQPVANYYNNKINLFKEDDAKILNNLINYTFSQLLSSRTVRMSISELTKCTYGNRFTKNKERVKERLLNMYRYGIKRSYINDLDQHIEERIVFLPEVRLIEDQHLCDVEIEFSTTLRKNLLTNLMVNYSSAYAIPGHQYKTNYAYLLLQIVLEQRVISQTIKSQDFEVDIPYDTIKQKIHFPADVDIIAAVQPALEELKQSSEYLIDYKLNASSVLVKLKAITDDEINFMTDTKKKIVIDA